MKIPIKVETPISKVKKDQLEKAGYLVVLSQPESK
jgi:hypothetical protein